jgi:glycosyltransferase involved in cell wall biosynthesis
MISILLAVYNGEKYMNQSIDSIINQTFKDWELLIGFNGTTDGSKDIASSYSDDRIKIFNYGKDKGKAKTLNKLIKEAKYDWCAIQDDDDIWLPEKLEKQFYQLDYFDVIGTLITYIDENNTHHGSPNLATDHEKIKSKSLSGINQIANSSAVFRKQDALEIGVWGESLDGIEDFDFWIKMLRKGCFFYNIPECLVLHRIHKDSNFNTKQYSLSEILRC